MTKKELEARVAQLENAVRWALGEGDSNFGDLKPEDAPSFWWRTELCERAGLAWDRQQERSVYRSSDRVVTPHE